jgi:hypothetical protein
LSTILPNERKPGVYAEAQSALKRVHDVTGQFGTSLLIAIILPANDRHLDYIYDEPALSTGLETENITRQLRVLQEQAYHGFNISTLNFTWAIQNFTNDTMTVKLNWTCPLCISPMPEQDHIFINFTNATYVGMLYSTQLKKTLHSDYQVLDSRVTKQNG